MNKKQASSGICLLIIALLGVSGCGGGGNDAGTSPAPPPPPAAPPAITAPSALTYAGLPSAGAQVAYTVGSEIPPLIPSVTGQVTSYAVSPALPPGLQLNTSTGRITGTPTAVAPRATYTITAGNSAGQTTFALAITVNSVLLPPASLSYLSPQIYTVGTAISPLTPVVTGTVSTYSVSPALPAGLSLQTSTGQITGTPTAAAPQATYTITASNASGSTTFGLMLTVSNASYTIGGTVSGLVGSGLVLSVNGGSNLGVSANGSFVFGGTLPSGAAYSVEVAGQPTSNLLCKVANARGTVSSSNVTNISVTCALPSWGVEALLDTSNACYNYVPEIAMQKNGSAIAVWLEGCTPNRIIARRYTVAGGWSAPEIVGSPSIGTGLFPQAVIDGAGNATVIWRVRNDNSLYYNRHVPATGWSGVASFPGGPGGTSSIGSNILGVQAGVDANGNVIAIWMRYQSAAAYEIYHAYASRYVPGTGWSMATLVSEASGSALEPQIAVDEAGNAMAVWMRQGDGTSSIYANRYVAGTDWGSATRLDALGSYASAPFVAVGASGSAMATWSQATTGPGDDSYPDQHARLYVAGSGWQTTAVISDPTKLTAANGRIGLDPNGNAISAWVQQDENSPYPEAIYANRYTPGSGWGLPQKIQTGSKRSFNPALSVDPRGNAIVVWEQYDDSGPFHFSNVWSNRYVSGSSWGVAEQIQVGASQSEVSLVVVPQVATDEQGRAIAVWYETRNNFVPYDIWTNRFD